MIVIPEWGEGHENIFLLAVGFFVWVTHDYMSTLLCVCVLPEMQEWERIDHCRQCDRGCLHLPFRIFMWIGKAREQSQLDCLSFCIVLTKGFPSVRHCRRNGVPYAEVKAY